MITKKNIKQLIKHFACCFLILFLSCSPKKNTTLNQNNLSEESSTYLLQHAKNPVNWQPWDENLYRNENTSNKLIIVSIGYSSCHWCHVMEKETFEDKNVADFMNEKYVSIKVDREENPDVDKVYMTAVQLLTGSGGWPLNAICLPNGKPIYAGTYHTKNEWTQVLQNIQKRYEENPKQLFELADKITEGIQSVNVFAPAEDKPFTTFYLDKPIDNWKQNLDFEYGGEIQDQKFINPVKMDFLRVFQTLTKDSLLNEHLSLTLNKISRSGIYDALEGGFFRYCVDPYWEVPHFEKMLYDNAQVIGMFADAYKQNSNPIYKDVVVKTISFLKKKMAAENGGFYASIDADNSSGEGRYYMFSKNEIMQIAGKNLQLFMDYYGIDFGKPTLDTLFTLRKAYADSQFVKLYGIKEKRWKEIKNEWESNLRHITSIRDFPLIDNKIITSWNALAILGLTKSYQAFGEESWLLEAEKTFAFLAENLFENDVLYHTYQNNAPKVAGFLEDYAFLSAAALELYKSTGKESYLHWSEKISEIIVEKFNAKDHPFFTYKMDNPLLSKVFDLNDVEMPSSNAVIAHTLFDLGHVLERKDFLKISQSMLQTIKPFFEDNISYYSLWASLYVKHAFPRYEVIVIGSNAKIVSDEIQKKYLTNVLFQQSTVPSELPFLKDRYSENETLIYVCKNNVCFAPEISVEAALAKLNDYDAQNKDSKKTNIFSLESSLN
jgi:uncharacterized protein YyaL (SSP411 family)